MRTARSMPYNKSKMEALEGLHFKEEGHTYTHGPFTIPGVTTVISSFTHFANVPTQFLEEARNRGRRVHELTELFDKRVFHFDVDSIGLEDDRLDDPYLNGWANFLSDTGFQVQEIEQKVYHRRHRYAGTLDRVGLLDDILSVVDIKTGTITPEYAWQTAAYREAANDGRASAKVQGRWVVQLTSSGTYKMVEHKDPTDLGAFLAALTIYNWRSAHGGY